MCVKYKGGSKSRRPKASSAADVATATAKDGASNSAAAAPAPIIPFLNARTLRLDDSRLQRGPALSLNPAWNESPALVLGPLLGGLTVGPPKLSAAEATAAAAAEAAQAAGASAVYGLGGVPASSSGASNQAKSGGGGGNRAQRGNAASSSSQKALFHKDAVYGDVENALFHYRQANQVYSASSSSPARHHLPLHVGNALGSARLRVLRAERLRTLVLPFDHGSIQEPNARVKALPTTTTPPPTLMSAGGVGGSLGSGAAGGRSNQSLPPWLLARLPANGLPEWAWAALAEAERDVEVAVASIEDLLYAVNSKSTEEQEVWGSLQAELGVARRLRSTGKKAGEHIETALQARQGYCCLFLCLCSGCETFFVFFLSLAVLMKQYNFMTSFTTSKKAHLVASSHLLFVLSVVYLPIKQAFERAASVFSQRLCQVHGSDPRYHYTPFQPSQTISGDALKNINNSPSSESSSSTADGSGNSTSGGMGAGAGARMRQSDALPSTNGGGGSSNGGDNETLGRFGAFLDHSELAHRFVICS